MPRSKVIIFFISFISLNAFQADCTLENGKHFHIELTNNILVVDWKYKVFYQANLNNWDYYENKGFVYTINQYHRDTFFIQVKNKKFKRFKKGMCIK